VSDGVPLLEALELCNELVAAAKAHILYCTAAYATRIHDPLQLMHVAENSNARHTQLHVGAYTTSITLG
jgi:hypothetical protein